MSWIYLFICLFIHCKCCGSRESYCINGTFFCKVKLAFFDVPVSRNNWNAFFFSFMYIRIFLIYILTVIDIGNVCIPLLSVLPFLLRPVQLRGRDWIVLKMVLNSLWFYSNSITFLRCLFIFLTIRNFVSLFGNGKKMIAFFFCNLVLMMRLDKMIFIALIYQQLLFFYKDL